MAIAGEDPFELWQKRMEFLVRETKKNIAFLAKPKESHGESFPYWPSPRTRNRQVHASVIGLVERFRAVVRVDRLIVRAAQIRHRLVRDRGELPNLDGRSGAAARWLVD